MEVQSIPPFPLSDLFLLRGLLRCECPSDIETGKEQLCGPQSRHSAFPPELPCPFKEGGADKADALKSDITACQAIGKPMFSIRAVSYSLTSNYRVQCALIFQLVSPTPNTPCRV